MEGVMQMVCIYMGEINGKRYCLAGCCNKRICDEERCEFYVDLDAVKRNGVWNDFGFGREKEGESDEVGRGVPPKESALFSKYPLMPPMTAEHPNSFSRCKWCDG